MAPVPAASALPPDLAFLLRHGVSPAALQEAAQLASRWNTAGAEAAVASGIVGANDYYRALAAELDLPFLDKDFAVHEMVRFPEAVLSGIAPLADTQRSSYVLAPRAFAVAGLLERRSALVPGLAMATPDGLRQAVFRARAQAIAVRASEQLPRERPDHSYHAGPSWPQALGVLAILVSVAATGFALGRPAFLALILLFGCPFLALAAVKIAAALDPAPIKPPAGIPRIPDADLPIYTVLVPLHRESRVLPKLRAALIALEYPAARLDVKLLIEAGDDETKDAIAAVSWPGFVEIVEVPLGVPRTKPRALNVGLALARGRYVVVYDAEDVPDPGQLRDAVATFARMGPDVACLQARLVIDNTSDSLLTRFFTVEYGGLFDVVNPALADFDLPVPLGGTSNHLKTEVVRALGGWDAWNVTEDADLGVRLARVGYRVADLPSATLEEAPATLKSWLAQRTRWMKGYVQVAITHSREPGASLRTLGPWRFAGASLLVGGAVFSAAIYPIFTALLAAQVASGAFFAGGEPLEVATASLSGVLFIAGLAAMVLPALAAVARRGWWTLLPFAFLMPAYYLLVSLGAWRGIWELVVDPDRWNKTEHGLARTSRSGTALLTAPEESPSPPAPADDRD